MVSDHPDDDNTKMYIFVINKDENYNRNGCFMYITLMVIILDAFIT